MAAASKACRTVVFPDPFGPRRRVNGASARVVFRSALKFLNSMDAIIGVSERVAAASKEGHGERTNFSGATAQRVQPLGRKLYGADGCCNR